MGNAVTRAFLLIVFNLSLSLCIEASDDNSQVLQGALGTLDQFMLAGKEGDANRGAQFVDMYDWSPRKAEREIGEFFKERKTIFRSYVSISNDIYGYEIDENGFKGLNLNMEGGVETTDGFTAEFSARLVLRENRWLILSFELD